MLRLDDVHLHAPLSTRRNRLFVRRQRIVRERLILFDRVVRLGKHVPSRTGLQLTLTVTVDRTVLTTVVGAYVAVRAR